MSNNTITLNANDNEYKGIMFNQLLPHFQNKYPELELGVIGNSNYRGKSWIYMDGSKGRIVLEL